MTIRALLLAIGAALLASNACAHPRVKSTAPAENQTVASSPTTIQIEFTERLVAKFSGIELLNAENESISIGRSEVLAGNSRVLVAPIVSKLPAGDYTVVWHAVAADTHRVEGRYTFHIKP
jgi:copper resistance protein C